MATRVISFLLSNCSAEQATLIQNGAEGAISMTVGADERLTGVVPIGSGNAEVSSSDLG